MSDSRDPMDCSAPGFPVLHQLLEFVQMHVHCVDDAFQPFQPRSPLLLPSVFPSIRVFSNEPALHITWPKYWSFSFSISSSNDYSGLISFGIDTPELVSSMFSSHLPLHAVCTAGDSLCSAHSGNVFLLLRAFGNVGCSPIPLLDLRKPSKSAFCLTQAVYFPQLIPWHAGQWSYCKPAGF